MQQRQADVASRENAVAQAESQLAERLGVLQAAEKAAEAEAAEALKKATARELALAQREAHVEEREKSIAQLQASSRPSHPSNPSWAP